MADPARIPDSPANGAGPYDAELSPLARALLHEIRSHGKRTTGELAELRKDVDGLHDVLVEIRDRLPPPEPAHPEVDAAVAETKVTALTALRKAADGAAGVWLVRTTWATALVLVLGCAGWLGLKVDFVRPGAAMPPLFARALGYQDDETAGAGAGSAAAAGATP
jgi:hypothetical protein